MSETSIILYAITMIIMGAIALILFEKYDK